MPENRLILRDRQTDISESVRISIEGLLSDYEQDAKSLANVAASSASFAIELIALGNEPSDVMRQTVARFDQVVAREITDAEEQTRRRMIEIARSVVAGVVAVGTAIV